MTILIIIIVTMLIETQHFVANLKINYIILIYDNILEESSHWRKFYKTTIQWAEFFRSHKLV